MTRKQPQQQCSIGCSIRSGLLVCCLSLTHTAAHQPLLSKSASRVQQQQQQQQQQ
jgi:hypothetical protein